MLKLLKQEVAIGLEWSFQDIKSAKVVLQKGNPRIQSLLKLPISSDQKCDVKPLYIDHSVLATGLAANDVLIRPLYIPLVKEKDIEEAFAFQAEPHLPYPTDQAILARQTLQQNAEGTQLTLLSARKDLLQKHLEQWQKIKIEPEQVGCLQSALCYFGHHYIAAEHPYIILHLSEDWITCVLVKGETVIASYTHQEGLKGILKACEQELSENQSWKEIDFQSNQDHPILQETIKRLQQYISRMCYALVKDCKGEQVSGIVVTGEAALSSSLELKFVEKLNLPLLKCKEDLSQSFSSEEKQCFAVSIGLAIGALKKKIDFRQQELSYPYPWQRIKGPLISYLVLMIGLACTFYLFGHHYLKNKEDQIKQEYVDLLSAMNKSHEQFEQAFLAKHPAAKEKYDGEQTSIIDLDSGDLSDRLEFLHKDLQATPDSFPLFANIPRVSDVLAWLSTHPLVSHKNEEGIVESRLQLESFNYVMLKRPIQGKKQEKYQVKVELEFSSPTPKWAREFHDALIASNDFVDSKAEVKWSSNRGRYRTSFYLKDKTSYTQ